MLIPITIMLSYIGSLPFGMINLNVLYVELTNGRRAALRMAVGASVIECVQGVVAGIIYSRLLYLTQYDYLLKWASIAVFIFLALYYFFKKKKEFDLDQVDKKEHGFPFLKGLLLSSLNFMAMPYWLIIMGMISNYISVDWNWENLILFGIGAGLGGFFASFTYVIIGKRFFSRSTMIYQYLDFGLGTLFLILAILAVYLG